MIKIIKHGRFKQCLCNNCGCIFMYENEDIKHEHKGAERNMVNPLL